MGGFNTYPALDIKQPESPLDTYGKAMQLKALAGQIAAQPGQLELQQQQIEMQKRMLDDKQAETAAMKEWAEGQGSIPMDKLPDLMLKHGASADAAMKMRAGIIQQNEAYQKMTKDQRDNAIATADAIHNKAADVLSLPQELQPAAHEQAQQELIQAGIIKPDHKIPYDPDTLKMLAAGSAHEKQYLQEANQKAEAAAAALKAKTEADRLKWEQEGGGSVDKQEMADWLKKNPGKGPSDFMIFKAKNSPTMLLQGGAGGAGDPMVDMVGQGRVDLATALQRMPTAAKESFMKALSTKYPTYNQATYGVEKKVQETFTSGEAAKNLTAFNTAIEHSKQLDEAAKALTIGDNRTLNKIGNALGYEFGSDRTTNFNVIKSALTGEISKVFKGGQATDAEIKEVQGPFDAANSPAQLRGAIANAVRLMNSKRDALKQQYEQGKQGKPNFGEEQHTPGGKAAGLTEGQTGTGSDGKKYIVKGGVWVPQ